MRLMSRQDLQKLRNVCQKALSLETKKILVCGGTGCVAGGSLDIYDRLKAMLEERGIPVSVELAHEPHEEAVGLKKSGCHGFCEMGPLVRVEPQGWLYTKVKLDDCQEIVEKTIIGGECVERLAYRQNGFCAEKPWLEEGDAGQGGAAVPDHAALFRQRCHHGGRAVIAHQTAVVHTDAFDAAPGKGAAPSRRSDSPPAARRACAGSSWQGRTWHPE